MTFWAWLGNVFLTLLNGTRLGELGFLLYFSSRSLPLFYILHMNPLHAAENGDLTQIGLKNNVKTKILSVEPSTWKADDTFTLDYPGMYNNIGHG